MQNKFKSFIKSESFIGILLMAVTIVSLLIANSSFADTYHYFLNDINVIGHFNLHMIINEFLMAIFFLYVGGEIKHEILHGNLSSIKKASFPIIGAIGGVLIPAIIFLIFNSNTEFSNGIGVPISTDIAFAIGIFMLLKNKVNPLLKIFLLTLAVVDDLISILVIGVLYSTGIKIEFLILSVITLAILMLLNRKKVDKFAPYSIFGLVLWLFIYLSGVHATISGVLLAIAIPSKKLISSKEPLLNRLIHKLGPLCNFIILPLFALSNTAISLNLNIDFGSAKTLIDGILYGLVFGKPLGIMLFTWLGTKLHITEKPEGVDWISIFSVSLLAGIGFTMSIFVTEIAFGYNEEIINISKISILLASTLSILLTYIVVTATYRYKQKSGDIIFEGNLNADLLNNIEKQQLNYPPKKVAKS